MKESAKLTVGQCASLACLLEATAPKAGNVHRGADFEDLTWLDFATSAVLVAPAFDAAAAGARLGATVLTAVRATREGVGTNTNLGTILLLAPLAMVPREQGLVDGIADVLSQLDADDARSVYRAIRLAQPGGLGQVERDDVAGDAPPNLVDAMRLAADRDLVARQYVNGFHEALRVVAPWLAEGLACGWPLADTIVQTQLRLMSQYPDSLIARKCGPAVASNASDRASRALAAGEPGQPAWRQAVVDLDFWLRCDGHRRNPGTTADLVAAGLFAALRDGIIQLPLRFYGVDN